MFLFGCEYYQFVDDSIRYDPSCQKFIGFISVNLDSPQIFCRLSIYDLICSNRLSFAASFDNSIVDIWI